MPAPCSRHFCQVRDPTWQPLPLWEVEEYTSTPDWLWLQNWCWPPASDCSSVCYQNQVNFVSWLYHKHFNININVIGDKGSLNNMFLCSMATGRRYSERTNPRDPVHVCHLKLEGISHKRTLIWASELIWLIDFTGTKHDYLHLSSCCLDLIQFNYYSNFLCFCFVSMLRPCCKPGTIWKKRAAWLSLLVKWNFESAACHRLIKNGLIRFA